MTRSASAAPLCRLRHQDSGAGRPARRPSPTGRRVVSCGASANSRARPSDSRSPRLRRHQRMQFVEHHALAASRTGYGASAMASSSASCSGVVSRMSGGSRRWRWRFEAGVSPVRVSMPDRQAHLGDRRFEIARDVDRQRLQRRDVERVQARRRGACRGRWKPASCALLRCRRARSTPPASAEIPPASCRRRSARSAAPSGRRCAFASSSS